MGKMNLNFYNKLPVDPGQISHEGIITAIHNNRMEVSLIGNIHCESCNAKNACGVSDTSSKTVEVFRKQDSFSINEKVVVAMREGLGLKAVLWAYIVPFVLLMATLIFTLSFFNEGVAGILAISILVPYYTILYFSKNAFRRAFSISVYKTNKDE